MEAKPIKGLRAREKQVGRRRNLISEPRKWVSKVCSPLMVLFMCVSTYVDYHCKRDTC